MVTINAQPGPWFEMPATEEPMASIELSHILKPPNTSTSPSDSRASSCSETSSSSTAASTLSYSGSATIANHAATPRPGTPYTSAPHSRTSNNSSKSWSGRVILRLWNRIWRVETATEITLPAQSHQTITTAPSSASAPTSSQLSPNRSPVSGDVNQDESPSDSMSARTIPLLHTWWNKMKETSKFRDRMGATGGGATLLITIVGLVYYAHRTDELSRWTAAKDYIEQCRNELSANMSTPQCRTVLTKHLLPPPYQPENFYTGTTKRDRLFHEALHSDPKVHLEELSTDQIPHPATQGSSHRTSYAAVALLVTVIVAAILCGMYLLRWRLYWPEKARQKWMTKVLVRSRPVETADESIVLRIPVIRERGLRKRRIYGLDPELDSEQASEQEHEQEHHQESQECDASEVEKSLAADFVRSQGSGYVAMRYAMHRGDVPGLKALLDFHCDPEARGTDGSPISHFFTTHEGPQVDSQLESLLKIACSRPTDAPNYIEMVQLIVSRCNPTDWLCLALAAHGVSQEVVRILLQYSANIYRDFIMSCACSSRVDEQNRTQPLIPIMFQREREAIIELLIEAGFPLDARHGPGPLHMAAGMHPTPAMLFQKTLQSTFRPNLNPDVQLCKYLLARGADPLRLDNSGERPRLEGLGLDAMVAETFNPTEKLAYFDDVEDFTWVID